MMTASNPLPKSSSTVDLYTAPSSNTAQPTLLSSALELLSLGSPDAMLLSREPIAWAAEVGPNHCDGSLPSSFCPAYTMLCSDSGASGMSKKHAMMSKYSEPGCKSASALYRQARPSRRETRHCATSICITRTMQPQPESDRNVLPFASCNSVVKPPRYVSKMRDWKSSRNACCPSSLLPSYLMQRRKTSVFNCQGIHFQISS
mmetsp:Transcript_65784/g.122667  ORF Transcript_65784/g.122667 Transcript_65784/m.122667 type:complete len:203 (-) Transcript_65784:60-668(-)